MQQLLAIENMFLNYILPWLIETVSYGEITKIVQYLFPLGGQLVYQNDMTFYFFRGPLRFNLKL